MFATVMRCLGVLRGWNGVVAAYLEMPEINFQFNRSIHDFWDSSS